MRTFITTLLLATTLILASCGGGNDVASSGATAVSAAATDSSSTSAPSTTTATTEPKVNGQIDERTGVAPVVAQMTMGVGVTYFTRYLGNNFAAFLGNSSFPCAFGSSPNQAIVSCLNSSVNQFAFYILNGTTYITQSLGGNSPGAGGNPYGAFLDNGFYACGFGSTPNQAIVSCLN